LAVQFQQHRAGLGGRNTNARRPRLARSSSSRKIPPCINSARDARPQQQQQSQHRRHRNPLRRRRDANFLALRCGLLLRSVRHVVFRQQPFFIQSQKPRNRAYKSPIEHTPRQFLPVLVFHRLQKTVADACGGIDFVERYFAQLALAFQSFSEISPGHSLVLQMVKLTAAEPRLNPQGARNASMSGWAKGKPPEPRQEKSQSQSRSAPQAAQRPLPRTIGGPIHPVKQPPESLSSAKRTTGSAFFTNLMEGLRGCAFASTIPRIL
jgi:hypothetical protein